MPRACARLFEHAARWHRLRVLHLANVAFPPAPSWDTFVFPVLPALAMLSVHNATNVPVRAVAALVCGPAGAPEVCSVRLVDCYVESIWGGRVRRRHVERAAAEVEVGRKGEEGDNGGGGVEVEERELRIRIRRVRAVVVCEAVNERIEGGDRVLDGITILE